MADRCDICGGLITPGGQLRRAGNSDSHADPHACIYSLVDRIAVLEAALRPFADMGRHLKDEVREDKHWQPYIKAKCYRDAKLALEAK